ncbi:hypothetical protein SDJN02_20398 [Cucurbita argyrosperma subsp. argyrosperma]|nr:hypothetical protein SDJN02_20398 [Cucurbita argyrosperma subsp. argyrosperma]
MISIFFFCIFLTGLRNSQSRLSKTFGCLDQRKTISQSGFFPWVSSTLNNLHFTSTSLPRSSFF